MAGADPNSPEWGDDVARRVFQIVIVGTVLFIGATLLSIW